MTLREINRATLARQMLLARARIAPLAAIERLVALQAQWPRPPFVGLWSRLQGFERAQLAALFAERRVVRATFLRATIHVVSSRDFLGLRPTIQPALEGAMHGILGARLAGLDLDRLVADAHATFASAPQSFEALRDQFLRADPAADQRAMGYAVRMLLPLVQVPVEDAPWGFPAQACFAPAEQWLRRRVPTRPAPPDPLILRYLAAYGPATAADVQAWSGLPRKTVAEAIERLRPGLLAFPGQQKKGELLDLPDAPRPGAEMPAPVRFVPEYDNLITARADERFVAKAHRPRVFLSALRIAATVLVDGFAAATWKLHVTRKAAGITISPFTPFTARVRKEVLGEAEALVRFVEPGARSFEVRFH